MAKTHVQSSDHEQPVAETGKRSSAGAAIIRGLRGDHWQVLNPFRPLPEMPDAKRARAGLIAVSILVLAYIVFFTAYLWSRQDAFVTHAEDLGIMDQALWNTVHGAPLHQTVCNIVSDRNCLGDISRLAIHFEPLMFVISLLYLVAPSPKTIQFLQVAVAALGAFPAFWIAGRRLQSVFAGLAFALIYLLYPSLQAAVTYDFHAVTLSSAFLLFAIYFILTRNNVGMFVMVLLALSTKEEIVVDVGMLGLAVFFLQGRRRTGAALLAISVVWLVMELAIMRNVSPLGHSPTAGRYAYLGHPPVSAMLYLLTHLPQVLREHVLTHEGIYYLRVLLSPAAYLAIFSPLALIIAGPALGINLLSSDKSMHSGYYQYNAEIVPVLIFAAIEGVAVLSVLLAWAYRRLLPVVEARLAGRKASSRWAPVLRRGRMVPISRVAIVGLTVLALTFGFHEQHQRGFSPIATGFEWPQVTAHDRLGERIAAMIPANASVSAQSDLVPHVSHRHFIYMYPYMANQSDYVFLDVTGNLYPYFTAPQIYFHTVTSLLGSGQYHIVTAQDGYLLLKRGPSHTAVSPPSYGLPASFFTFATQPTSAAIPNSEDVRFGSSLHLVGYSVQSHTELTLFRSFSVTTYWRVDAPVQGYAEPQLLLGRDQQTLLDGHNFATTQWVPVDQWQPGKIYVVQSWPLPETPDRYGYFRAAVRVIGQDGAALPVTPVHPGPSTIQGSIVKLDTYFGS